METSNQPPSTDETITPLRGVLLYEDRDAHARALNLNAYLAIEVARDIPINFSWWAIPLLSSPQSAGAARSAVAEADLVIVAAKRATDWPLAFKLWIESWALPEPRKLSAVGALFSSPPGERADICGRQAYLQYVAARLKLDFLAAAPDATAQLMKAKLGIAPQPNQPETFNVVDRPDYSPFCGING